MKPFKEYFIFNLSYEESNLKNYLTEEEITKRKKEFRRNLKKFEYMIIILAVKTILINLFLVFKYPSLLILYISLSNIFYLYYLVVDFLNSKKFKFEMKTIKIYFSYYAVVFLNFLFIAYPYLMQRMKNKKIIEKEIIMNNVKHKLIINGNLQEFLYNENCELHSELCFPAKKLNFMTEEYYYQGEKITLEKNEYFHNKDSELYKKKIKKIKRNKLKNNIKNF